MSDEQRPICPECTLIYPPGHSFCSQCGGRLHLATFVQDLPGSPEQKATPKPTPSLDRGLRAGLMLALVVALICVALLVYRSVFPGLAGPTSPAGVGEVSTVEADGGPAVPTFTPAPLPTAGPTDTDGPQSQATARSEPLPTVPPPRATPGGGQAGAAPPTDVAEVPATDVTEGHQRLGGLATPATTATQESSACISWRDAGNCVGRECCICGQVTSTYYHSQSGVFFINFTQDRSAFYAVSFDHSWDEGVLEDTCLQVCGRVETYEGRPQIVIRDPEEQMLACP